MREETVVYVHLPSGSEPPKLEFQHRRVIVLIEQDVDAAWQERISDWIAGSGCLYMMAWGRDCSSWDDSVDHANLLKHAFGEIPDERFIMTTWHDNEPLSEVFFFDQMCAFHPDIELNLLTILHISELDKHDAVSGAYQEVRVALETETETEPVGVTRRMKNRFLNK